MRSHLFPTFTMDAENFELAIPIISTLAEELDLPCCYWRQGSGYAFSFKDLAVNHSIYYTAKHEQIIIDRLQREVEFNLSYVTEETFNKGKIII